MPACVLPPLPCALNRQQGWRLATGRSQENMLQFSLRAIMAAFVMWLALLATSHSANVIDLIEHFQGIITNAIAGENFKNPETMIDGTMVLMQTMASQLNQMPGTESKALMSTALIFIAGMGQALPALVSGGLLLLNRIALYLCVLFAPLCLAAYLFDKSRFVFVNWLKFTVTTLFSLAIITVVVIMAMKAVLFVTAALLLANMTGPLTLESVATAQGGVGMLMTTLILGAPPLIANFFSGSLAMPSVGYNPLGQLAQGKVSASPQDAMMQRTAQAGNSMQANANASTASGNVVTDVRAVSSSSQNSETYANEGGIKTSSQAQHGVATNAATTSSLNQDVQRANSQIANVNTAQGSTGSSGSAHGTTSQSAAQTNAAEERALAAYKQSNGGSSTSTSSYNASSASNSGSNSTTAASNAAAANAAPSVASSNAGPVDIRRTGPGADSEELNKKYSRGINSPNRNV